MSLAARYEQVKARYAAADQAHVFNFWDTLAAPAQSALLEQLESIDPAHVNTIYKAALEADDAAKHASADEIEPLPANVLESVVGAPEREAAHRAAGLKEIASGRVAVLLMAGGQGTRLGSADPKGCYDIGLPSHKSLFQLQAERILRLQRVAEKEIGKPAGSVKIRWYIMTSEPTHDATRKFFGWGTDGKRIGDKVVNFGLDADQVVFFKQGVLPCLSASGKILLESSSKVAVAPGGNGGLYAALRNPLTASLNNLTAPSILADLEARGISFIHAYGVDNCLVKVADPVFLGACAARSADCAAKTVPKERPDESVGVVACRKGAFAVVEYSEITAEQASRRDSTGALALRAGNIVNHVYTLSFLNRTLSMERALAHHVARKKIPSILSDGTQGKTDGMKLEMFVFDVFPFAERFLVLEGERREEFSPLKNAPGAPAGDCPETSRRDLLAQQRRFLEAAGAKFSGDPVVELSPLVTYAGEGLESVKGKTFSKSGFVESVEELDALV